jgi:multidrug resistance efflux pump
MIAGASSLGVLLLVAGEAAQRGLLSLPHAFTTTPAVADGAAGREDAAPLPDAAVLVGSGDVDVEGGVTPLTPLPPGQVAEVLVQEGQPVAKKTPLLRLESKLAALRVAEAQATVEQAQTRLTQAKRAAAEHTLQVAQQDQAIAIATAQERAQQVEINRLARLVKEKLMSAKDFEAAQENGAAARAAVKREQLRREQLALIDPASTIRLAEAELTLARGQLATAQEQLAEHTLLAPEDGVVLRVLANVGQVLGPAHKQPALWFQPARPLIVRCEVDQQFVDRVSPGMACDIYEDRLDQPGWKGRVQRCSGWIAPRRSAGDDPTERRDARTLECIITFDRPPSSLRIGQRLRVVFRGGGRS